MKYTHCKIMNVCFGFLLMTLGTTAEAGSPLWTFVPLTATTISVPLEGTATVEYLVTNQSSKTHTLVMQPIVGITQVTSGNGTCSSPFILGSHASCTLSLSIDGGTLTGSIMGGPVVCQQGASLQCYRPALANTLSITRYTGNDLTTLSASVSALALSVSDTALNAALTGTPRIITITNTGLNAATSVSYSPSPALPAGTTISPSSCGTIAPSSSCTLTITPGATPSSTSNDTNPTPVVLSISGANTNTVSLAVHVLTYGSVYQGGYLYAVNDSTPNTGSIGGKVAALVDQSSAIAWGATGTEVTGISDTSTAGEGACAGNTDGACNTSRITTLLTDQQGPNLPLTTYAAGLCKAAIEGYSDWYLPAICELGYGLDAGCGVQSAPLVQNMQSNLFDNGNIGGLSIEHWSSTESSVFPTTFAWFFWFQGEQGSAQIVTNKVINFGVRCSRALTP